tara:strand:+ start:480 stop:707 length:228 start_codon:yes stop_codon:yes gene_type:complete
MRATEARQAETTQPTAPTPAPVPHIPEAPVEVHVEPAAVDYEAMTKTELQDVLDDRSIVYARYATKAALVELAES